MKSTYDKIWSTALRQIQIRMLSRFSLQQKLIKKYPDENSVIEKVLDEMEVVQLLNDKRYSQELIHHLIQRPIGRIKINIECRKRGLDEALIQNLLMEADYNEEDMCHMALQQKLKTLRETDLRKRKHKLMNFLKNRGFTTTVIYKAINRLPG